MLVCLSLAFILMMQYWKAHREYFSEALTEMWPVAAIGSSDKREVM
jgi:hypothetical protein